MARRRRFVKARKARKFTLPLAVVAGMVSPIGRAYEHYKMAGLTGQQGAIGAFSRSMTGINPYDQIPQFHASDLRYGLLPLFAGVAVHKVAGMIGINRLIAQAGIPVVRI